MSLFDRYRRDGAVERFDSIDIKYDSKDIESMISRLLNTLPHEKFSENSLKTDDNFTHPGIKGFELAFRQFEIAAGVAEHEFLSGYEPHPLPFLIADPIASGDSHKIAGALLRGWRIGMYVLSHQSPLFDYIDTNPTVEPKTLVRHAKSGRAIIAQAATVESPYIDFPNQWYGGFDLAVRRAIFTVAVDSTEENRIKESYIIRKQSENALL